MRGTVAPVPDESNRESVSVPLAPGVDAHLGMHDLDGSLEVGLVHEGHVVDEEVIPPDADEPRKLFSVELGPLSVELTFTADHGLGELRVRGSIRALGGLHADFDEVLRYNPAHGAVGTSDQADPPIFDDPRFGRTRMSSKNVTRIFVEDRKRLIADVGRVVKNTLWPDHEDWVFNTVACVGAFDEQGRGTYGDPHSPWFNVFLGYYQIDAAKPAWKRPFAYKSAKGADSKVDFEEIIRLGKSDWNYFSNWMYGVPQRAAERHNEIDMSKVRAAQSDGGAIGESSWHRVQLAGVDFVSAYESAAPGAEKLVDNSVISRVWRGAFGAPNPRPEFKQSFVPTTLDGDMYIAYWEDEAAFHTTIFGGTAPSGGDPEFLACQLAEAKKVIARSYESLGFSEAGSPRGSSRRAAPRHPSRRSSSRPR
jgi:hypothetical protein